MHFNLGAKLGGFLERHPIRKSKPAATPGQASTSAGTSGAGKSGFQVLGRKQQPQQAARPQPAAIPPPPAGWSSNSIGLQYPTHTGPANLGPAHELPELMRSGSPLQPNGIQHTQFGGAEESMPRGPLRVTNPDISPSSSPSSSRSSTPSPPPMHSPSNHPASLTPGMGTASRLPLSADLTFEQPAASRTQHPPSLTPGMGAAPRQEVSSDLLFQGPGPSHPHQTGNPAQRLTDIPKPLGPRPMNPGNG